MTESPKSPRRVNAQGWTTLTLAGAAIGIAISGPAHAGTGFGVAPNGPEKLWLAQSTESGEGGEGGESGVAASGDDVVELLTDLSLLEGYLRAGVALYASGRTEEAATHMKRPDDDVYAELSAHLAEFGAEDFATQLTTLADAVAAGKPVAEVNAAMAEVLKEIDEAREHGNATEAAEAQAIVMLLRHAAEDHAAGVADGKITDAHEYQDAWGFVETARTLAAHMAGEDDTAEKAFGQKALAALDEGREALPGLAPEGDSVGETAILLGAAAKIELAAYKLR